jgi:hypothetical protein
MARNWEISLRMNNNFALRVSSGAMPDSPAMNNCSRSGVNPEDNWFDWDMALGIVWPR